MGRAPCCDKANVKKGPWSPEEDAKLKSYIEQHGTGGNWIALPQKIGLKRCGKSCRLRWLNYLRPNIKHGGFSEEEDNIICSLYISIGSRWSIIAAQLPGRTDNDIKNYWNTRLKKKLLGNKQRKNQQAHRGTGTSSTGQSVKQEIVKKSGTGIMVNSMEVMNNNNVVNNVTSDQINPYWPELPLLAAPALQYYSNGWQPRCDDHASIRKLLIKLGGRFSDDDDHDQNNNNQPPIHGIASSTDPAQLGFPHIDHQHNNNQPLYHEFSGNMVMSASAPPPPLPEFGSQAVHNSQILQGQGGSSTRTTTNSLVAELEETVYNNNNVPGQVLMDGLEFFYGGNNSSITSTYGTIDQDISWGEMSSLLVYNNNVPNISNVSENYEGMQREVLLSGQEYFFGESSFPKAQ